MRPILRQGHELINKNPVPKDITEQLDLLRVEVHPSDLEDFDNLYEAVDLVSRDEARNLHG